VELAPTGLTVIHGGNGEGKTNLLEAVAWLATLESFRGAPPEALVRVGSPSGSAIVRATGSRTTAPGAERTVLIEGEITPRGRARAQVNRQPLRRARDLLGALRVSVFSPDDLVLVKGGPAERRRALDDLLVACHPRWDALRSDVERILRQRATLLKQAGGRLTPEVAMTLDVWDDKLATAGTALADARAALAARLEPEVGRAYAQIAGLTGSGAALTLSYWAPWRSPQSPRVGLQPLGESPGPAAASPGRAAATPGPAPGSPGPAAATGARDLALTSDGRPSGEAFGAGLARALQAARIDDVRRGVSTVGPHRDDLVITLDGLPARTHASQGEQRSLALALRLGGHGVVTEEAGDGPVLLLDDVFSELDPDRSAALAAHLPAGQALLTTAGAVPEGIEAAAHIKVRAGVATPGR